MSTERAEKKKGPCCPRCGNRLRLRADQIGEQVKCPKCDATFVVGRPGEGGEPPGVAPDVAPLAAESGSPAAVGQPSDPADALADAYEPEVPLQRVYSVSESEMADISPLAARPAPYDVDWSVADDMEVESHAPPPAEVDEHYLRVAEARGLLREPEQARPPKWTFFSGVWGYPWRAVNLSRWTAMGLGLGCAGTVSLAALSNLGFVGTGGNAILGIFMALFAVLMSLGTLSFSAASCDAALADTADGFDEPQESSLPDWDQWVFSLLALLAVSAFSAALGYPLSLALGPVAFPIVAALLFPVLWLSGLESGSFWLPFSAAVWGSLARHPGTWLLFYLISTPLLVAGGVGGVYVARYSPYLAVALSGPIVATLMLWYARWLGRLAWSVSQVSDRERRRAPAGHAGSDEPTPKAVRKRRGKPAKKRKQIFIPEGDAAASAAESSGPPARLPRLRFNRHA
jgi:hypothetical protein